jgi:Domain of unknown function (DUF4272)
VTNIGGNDHQPVEPQERDMITTKEWAESLQIASEADLPAVPGFSKPYLRTAREVAIRAIILHGVVAVAFNVKALPIVEWFEAQGIWEEVTPKEAVLLLNDGLSEAERTQVRWMKEVEWTLLWIIGMVESLGLPTHQCDTRRLVDEIVPPLGGDLEPFVRQAELRSPGALLAEDDRTYNLWCYTVAARRRGEVLPSDLNVGVLHQRRYAFEWLAGPEPWDSVQCDA